MSEQAIREVIQTAYIEGIHNEQDQDKVHAGFHSEFRMFMRRDGDIAHVDRDTILNGVIRQRKNNPASGQPPIECDISVLDIDEKAAVARINLKRDGVVGCVDYLSLYKFDDGWKIVSKIYQPHM